MLVRQLPNIGDVGAQALKHAGLSSLESFGAAFPGAIEAALKRKAGASALQSKVRAVPGIKLRLCPRADRGVSIHFDVQRLEQGGLSKHLRLNHSIFGACNATCRMPIYNKCNAHITYLSSYPPFCWSMFGSRSEDDRVSQRKCLQQLSRQWVADWHWLCPLYCLCRSKWAAATTQTFSSTESSRWPFAEFTRWALRKNGGSTS